MRPLAARAAFTGSIASVVSAMGLAALALLERRAPLQPINATSHWLNGPQAGRVERGDLRHTGVGYGTHHLAALFWAVPLEVLLGHRKVTASNALATSAAVAAFAGAFDYGAIPRSLTPGWELALPKRSVLGALGIFGASLAIGALATRRFLGSPERGTRDHQPVDGNDGSERRKFKGEPPAEERVVLGASASNLRLGDRRGA